MEASNNMQVSLDSVRVTLGQVAADLFEIDIESLDWDMSFIQLGGDSILAIDFIVRCRDAGVWVDMVELLTADTLSALADNMDRENGLVVNGDDAGQDLLGTRQENDASNELHTTKTDLTIMDRPLRFASTEITAGKDISVVSLALGRLISRHSALRSSWSVSPNGDYTLTTAPIGATDKPQCFFLTEASQSAQIDDVFEMLKTTLLSDGALALGCTLISGDEFGGSSTIVLAADANLVDVLSMRLILRELRNSIDGHELDAAPVVQFSDWIAAGCQSPACRARHSPGSKNSHMKQQRAVKTAIATRCSSTVTKSDNKSKGSTSVTILLPSSTTKKLFSLQTHAALRTTAVDVVNAALACTLNNHYREDGASIIIKSAYSVRQEQSLPLDLVGCYEAEVEWEAPTLVAKQNVLQTIRQVCDASARTSQNSENEQKRLIYLDCTKLHNTADDDEFLEWFSDPVLGHGPHVSFAAVGDQIQVVLQLDGDNQAQTTVAEELKLCLDEMVDQLAQAPEMATLREYPLISWSYADLDGLFTDLKPQNMTVTDIESIGPCSAVQESFFLSQVINPGSYVSHATIRLVTAQDDKAPSLDTAKVIYAWGNIVKRHAILRTSFVESSDRIGKHDQLVVKSTVASPRVAVFASRPDDNNPQPFETEKFQVPMRLSIYEVSAYELQLELDISHALVDGHSAKILLHDLRASYLRDSYFSEQAPLSYTDFAFQQQAILDAGEISAGVAYWTEYMNKAGESHLPLITTNPRLQGLETAHCTVPLPSGKLRAICGQLSITPANLFHIAWAMALRRIVLSNTITFSYIVSGRNSGLGSVEATVGPFINTLPFSLELAPETSVADVLGSSKKDWHEGSGYHHIPISELEVSKTRSLKRLGNTLLSIEREGSSSHPFAEKTDLNLSARTSATDVRALWIT